MCLLTIFMGRLQNFEPKQLLKMELFLTAKRSWFGIEVRISEVSSNFVKFVILTSQSRDVKWAFGYLNLAFSGNIGFEAKTGELSELTGDLKPMRFVIRSPRE